MSFAKVCATRDKSSSSQPQYVRSRRSTRTTRRVCGCCPRQLFHRSRARLPFYILQSPLLFSFSHLCFIRMDFLTSPRSDATSPLLGKLSPHAVWISPHVCACPTAWPSGRSAVSRPSPLPPSSLQPFRVVTAANGNIMHHGRGDSCLTRTAASRCGGGGSDSIDITGWSAKSLVDSCGHPMQFLSLSLSRTTVPLFLLLSSIMSDNHAIRVSGGSALLTAVGSSFSIHWPKHRRSTTLSMERAFCALKTHTNQCVAFFTLCSRFYPHFNSSTFPSLSLSSSEVYFNSFALEAS